LLSPLLPGHFGPELAKYASAMSPGTFIWPNASEIPYHFSTADFKFHFYHCFRSDCTRNAPPGNSTMRSRSELTMLRLRSAGRSRPDGCFFWLQQLFKPFAG